MLKKRILTQLNQGIEGHAGIAIDKNLYHSKQSVNSKPLSDHILKFRDITLEVTSLVKAVILQTAKVVDTGTIWSKKK